MMNEINTSWLKETEFLVLTKQITVLATGEIVFLSTKTRLFVVRLIQLNVFSFPRVCVVIFGDVYRLTEDYNNVVISVIIQILPPSFRKMN